MREKIKTTRVPGSQAKVFFALWPAAALRAQLHAMATGYRTQCGGRAMKVETLHLTLLFLGMVERARLEPLQQAVGRLELAPFSFQLARFCCWRHNRIGYAAPAAAVPELAQLSESLRQVAASVGVAFDRRAFAAHVTLLRNVERPIESQAIGPLEWHVEQFALVESVSTAEGVRYNTLQSWRCLEGSRQQQAD